MRCLPSDLWGKRFLLLDSAGPRVGWRGVDPGPSPQAVWWMAKLTPSLPAPFRRPPTVYSMAPNHFHRNLSVSSTPHLTSSSLLHEREADHRASLKDDQF